MSQTHLNYADRVNQGSSYTPPHIVDIALTMVAPHIAAEAIIMDNACGYGDFLKGGDLLDGRGKFVGCDWDAEAVLYAQKNHPHAHFFQANALKNVSRQNFGIAETAPLILVGNPPYNDKTSLIRRAVKADYFEIDKELISRDLGVSFLRSYARLRADFVCVLHPLSYLIKPTNFKALKEFAAHYRLLDGLVISSHEFAESAGYTPFPILIGLYKRGAGMGYEFVQKFRFKTTLGTELCLSDFDYVSHYIRKYPSKTPPAASDRDNENLYFWTMRDINALKRNRTFVETYSPNTIIIDKDKLDFYAYVDVVKRYSDRLPFYFGNCDVPIDLDLFRDYRNCFMRDAARHHPHLNAHISYANTDERHAINRYFKLVLREHYEL